MIAAELHMIFCEIVTMLVVGKIRGLKNYKDTVLILPFIMEIVGLHWRIKFFKIGFKPKY